MLEKMSMPSIWVFGREDRIIPTPRSAEIIEEVVAALAKPFTAFVYPNGDHSLEDDSGNLLPYWEEVLFPWFDEVLR